MSEKKYQTIVIAYEGDIPLKGFGVPVLGCEVVNISLSNECDNAEDLQEKVDSLERTIDELNEHM